MISEVIKEGYRVRLLFLLTAELVREVTGPVAGDLLISDGRGRRRRDRRHRG